MSKCQLLLQVAELLETQAEDIKRANSLDSKWFLDCAQAKADKRQHDKLMRLAKRVRKAV